MIILDGSKVLYSYPQAAIVANGLRSDRTDSRYTEEQAKGVPYLPSYLP